jgi:hypothetical protein
MAAAWAPTDGGERTFAWLHGFRRLRVRWERQADIHGAFLKLACCLMIHHQCCPWPAPGKLIA